MAKVAAFLAAAAAALVLSGCALGATRTSAPPEEVVDRRFATPADLGPWRVSGGEWTVRDGAAWGRQVGDNDAHLTWPVYFGSIRSVAIRGGIAGPENLNFRVQVGSVSAIFNWEGADEDLFRDGWGEGQGVAPRGLSAGVDHEILLVQDGDLVRILVDDRERWEARAHLRGTVTIYPALGSTVRVRQVEIRGVPVPWIPVDGPSQSAP